VNDEARAVWLEKLAFLLAAEAKEFDPAAKFKLKKDIEEARAKLKELPPDAKPLAEPADPQELAALDRARERVFGTAASRRLRWAALAGSMLAAVLVGVVLWRAAHPQVSVSVSVPGDTAQSRRTPEFTEKLNEGREALHKEDGARAVSVLAEALGYGDFPEAHAALAEAFNILGQEEEAKSEVKKAEDGSRGLPEGDEIRMWVQAQADLTSGRWDKARREYAALLDHLPGDRDAAVGLASSTLESQGPTRLLALLQEPSLRGVEDPRLDLAAARAEGALSNSEGQYKAASRALDSSAGKPLVAATARLLRGGALWALGRNQEARKDLAEAEHLAGDNPYLLGNIEDICGAIELAEGHFQEARVRYESARQIFSLRGNSGSVKIMDLNLASIHAKLGDLGKARRIYEGLVSPLFNPTQEELLRGSLGLILARQGDVAAASRQIERAYQVAGQSGDPIAKARQACNYALVQFWLLNLPQAESYLNGCREAANGDPLLTATALARQGSLLLLRGDLDKAHAVLVDSLARRRRLGDAGEIPQSLLDLAGIDLEAGRADDALRQAGEAFALLHEQPDPQAEAQVLQARAALALDKPDKARTFLDAAGARAVKSEELDLRVRYRLAAAELAERSGDVVKAQILITEAQSFVSGHPLLKIDAAVAAGALALRKGDRNQLLTVRAAAANVGYTLAVKRIDRLLGQKAQE